MFHPIELSNTRTDYVLGLLSIQDKQSFERHLKQCPECQEEISSERRLLQTTRQTLHAVSAISFTRLQQLQPPPPQRTRLFDFTASLNILQPIMAGILIFFIAVGSFGAIHTSASGVMATSTSTATVTHSPTAVATSKTDVTTPLATPAPPTPIAQLPLLQTPAINNE